MRNFKKYDMQRKIQDGVNIKYGVIVVTVSSSPIFESIRLTSEQ